MYLNLSFVFLYGRYVLFSKVNVTSKKSSSVRLATISILKSIFLKILIIFFRILSVCCLFTLRKINNHRLCINPYYLLKLYLLREIVYIYPNKLAEFRTIVAPHCDITCGISILFLPCFISVKLLQCFIVLISSFDIGM